MVGKQLALPRFPVMDEHLDVVLSGLHLNLVIEKPVGSDYHALLLCRYADGRYAACLVNTGQALCQAPNYTAEDNLFMLCGRLTQTGLMEILDWTTRETALGRFNALLQTDDPEPYEGLNQVFAGHHG